MKSTVCKQERGAALITVMFIFSIAAILAITMISKQQVDIVRTRNMLDHIQAYQYALAGETLARQLLFTNQTVTYAGQAWSNTNQDFGLEHGNLNLAIEDMQGKFNLNTLAGNQITSASYFQQLLIQQGISGDLVSSVVAQLKNSASNGTSNTVDDITILRAVEGISLEDYSALAPYITAFPNTTSLLNVNTASNNILRIYMPDPAIYALFLKMRASKGFVVDQQLRGIGMNTKNMTVTSNYFRVKAIAQVNNAVVNLSSIIYRATDSTSGIVKLNVISRDLNRIY